MTQPANSAQLRHYQLAEGTSADFVSEWLSAVVPLREAMGFVVESAWCDEAGDTFTWIVSYDGTGSQTEAEERYQAQKREHLRGKDPARHVDSASLHDVHQIYASSRRRETAPVDAVRTGR